MNATRWLAMTVVGMLGIGAGSIPSPCLAQGGAMHPATPAAGLVVITIYHVAAGKHLDFLRSVAQADAISKEAGIGVRQWYAHVDGDSWDFISIAPAPTPEQDAKADALSRQRGLPTGFAAGIQFRQFINSHTDTFARGPMSSADLVAAAAQR